MKVSCVFEMACKPWQPCNNTFYDFEITRFQTLTRPGSAQICLPCARSRGRVGFRFLAHFYFLFFKGATTLISTDFYMNSLKSGHWTEKGAKQAAQPGCLPDTLPCARHLLHRLLKFTPWKQHTESGYSLLTATGAAALVWPFSSCPFPPLSSEMFGLADVEKLVSPRSSL